MNKEIKIAVIGLGYVGLPLARLFSTKYKTVGFDMNKARVEALMQGHDATLEVRWIPKPACRSWSCSRRLPATAL